MLALQVLPYYRLLVLLVYVQYGQPQKTDAKTRRAQQSNLRKHCQHLQTLVSNRGTSQHGMTEPMTAHTQS